MKIVEVKDKKYLIDPFKGKKAFKIKMKLLRLLNPVLESLKNIKDDTSNEVDNKEDENFLAVIGDAIQHVLEKNTDDEIFDLLEELMSTVKTENGLIDFDTEFTQNTMSLYKLAKEVIMYNYEDVFQELGMNVR